MSANQNLSEEDRLKATSPEAPDDLPRPSSAHAIDHVTSESFSLSANREDIRQDAQMPADMNASTYSSSKENFVETASKEACNSNEEIEDDSVGIKGDQCGVELAVLDDIQMDPLLISPRDDIHSINQSDCEQGDASSFEALRFAAGSAMSDVSSYSWAREDTQGSIASTDSPNLQFGKERENLSSDEQTLHSSERPDSESSNLMTNELIEGPRITLPPSQLPNQTKYSDSAVNAPSGDSGARGDGPSEIERDKASKQNDSDLSEFQPSRVSSTPHGQFNSNGCTSSVEVKNAGQNSVITQSTPASSSSVPQPAAADSAASKPRVKKTPNDFVFGKVIGEGSYSTVYLAKEVSTGKEFAIKVCDKKHLIREKKTHFVMREKEVLMKLDHPFFIKLAYTFQDSERLYYVLTYARNGELLGYLHKLSVFDVPCTRFYSAEIVLALEYLHSLGIIHRDLKPENVLFGDDMHIKLADFGTSKILKSDGQSEDVSNTKKRNSFVGTAEYVSPEILNNEPPNFGSDLWALGCIIFQCLSSSLPFRSGNEYQTFQKIVKVEYEFPEGFPPAARDLVKKLLVLEPEERLGMKQPGGMEELKRHPFFEGIDWENLPTSTPPKLMPYLPANAENPEFWGQEQRTGFDDQRLAEIITGQSADGSMSPELEELPSISSRSSSVVEMEDKSEKLKKQKLENPFHSFVQDNLIIKQGFVDKRKGLFARKRMLLLTEGPHLYYVDAHNKVLKGEIPWSKYLRPEAKNFKIFFVHTPNRTYYLESRLPDAQHWVKKIKEVWMRYFGQDAGEN